MPIALGVQPDMTALGWLGLPPTNLRISMRVMDLWRREGALLKENWVFIDIPDLLLQMGVDVFARAAAVQPVAVAS